MTSSRRAGKALTREALTIKQSKTLGVYKEHNCSGVHGLDYNTSTCTCNKEPKFYKEYTDSTKNTQVLASSMRLAKSTLTC